MHGVLIELWCALDRVVVIYVGTGGADSDKHVQKRCKWLFIVVWYFSKHGKYIGGSYILYTDIMSGACDHYRHCHYRRDSLA